jgi:hypothetical protein
MRFFGFLVDMIGCAKTGARSISDDWMCSNKQERGIFLMIGGAQTNKREEYF